MVCVFLVFGPLCLPLFCSWLSLCLFLFASLLFICLSVCLFTCSRFGFFQFKSFVWVRLLLFRRRRRRCRHYQKRTQSCCPCRCFCCCCCYFFNRRMYQIWGQIKNYQFWRQAEQQKNKLEKRFFRKMLEMKKQLEKAVMSWVERDREREIKKHLE